MLKKVDELRKEIQDKDSALQATVDIGDSNKESENSTFPVLKPSNRESLYLCLELSMTTWRMIQNAEKYI